MMGGQSPGPLRIGLLGAARIAALAIVDPAHTTGDRLVAVAARDRRRAEAFAASHGVERVLDAYADVVADPEVEVVYNPLANGLHGPWNLAAIAAGKQVLTEKPSASNAEEAREVRDAATAAGLTLLEGFHYLYHPVTRRLQAASLGEMRSCTGSTGRTAARRPGAAPPCNSTLPSVRALARTARCALSGLALITWAVSQAGRAASWSAASAPRKFGILPNDQESRPAMRLTEPATIATPNSYDKKAWESTVPRIRRSRTVVSDTW
jgi:hypothetical protein